MEKVFDAILHGDTKGQNSEQSRLDEVVMASKRAVVLAWKSGYFSI